MLRYFHVPTGAWMGNRCYAATEHGFDRAVADYLKLAACPSVGAVEISEPGGGLLWIDHWVDLPLVTAVARVRDAIDAVKALG